MFIGILLLVIGVAWFLKDLGILPADLNMWPIFFIVLGLFILAMRFGLIKRRGHFCHHWDYDKEEK